MFKSNFSSLTTFLNAQWKIGLLILISLISVSGCSSVHIDDFENTKPEFVLEEYFEGDTTGWGVVLDRSGSPIKQFSVKMIGTRNGSDIVLEEFFSYNDGTKDTRVWTVKKKDKNQYSGTASDVVGEAIGLSNGNALNWKYTLEVPVDGSPMEIQFNDWMFLQDKDTLINKAVMSKYGIYVGEVLIFFRKS
jgi:hypothetical protein